MRLIRVRNMQNERNNTVKNQFEILTDKGTYFQSYQTLISFIPIGRSKILLNRNAWDYSRTTGRYRNIFLGETKKETEKKIKDGTYELVDFSEEHIN